MKSKEKQAKKAASSNAKIKATKKSGGGGLDEIDSLFAQKKQSDKELQQQIIHEKEQAKIERKRRKQARLEEEAEEVALRGGGASSAAAAGGEKKGSATSAPETLHSKAMKLGKLSYTRSDLEELNDKSKSERKDKWATDGLGGIFNGEGFTGRKDDGHRVFKAHLMNKEGFGQSPDCPFDCDCCFI
mmetsp:Transcript_22604/g.38667  ORF Transcript_22604/g.38667 Transcript_22604/m.38667 type:complete len:187 (-) Transcript_22604:74-634(-)